MSKPVGTSGNDDLYNPVHEKSPSSFRAALYGLDKGTSLSDQKIVVVDNSAFSRKTLTRFLAWIDITDIVFFNDGRVLVEQISCIRADLIVLDDSVGSLSGIETCKLLRGTDAAQDLPIIILITSLSDQKRAQCFHAGANDVISKPVNPGELIARLRYHIERRTLIAELMCFRERIERDLSVARSMQLALIPKPNQVISAAQKRGLSIDSCFESCDEIGGDFWSLYEIDDDRIGILVADFSGHGISAAINAFRFEALASRCSSDARADPGLMLTTLNRELCDILPLGQYCTAHSGHHDQLIRSIATT